MSTVVFDTNVVLDILSGRTGAFGSAVAYDIALNRGDRLAFLGSATTDVVYLLKSRRYRATEDQARRSIEAVFELFDIIPVYEDDCKKAFQSGMADYEDALVAYAAQREGADIIISRNKSDFKQSPVPVFTPEEYRDAFQPADAAYEEADL